MEKKGNETKMFPANTIVGGIPAKQLRAIERK